MRQLSNVGAVLFTSLAFMQLSPSAGLAQGDGSISVTQPYLQTNVPHSRPESFISATVHCQEGSFDDWEKVVRWDDGSVEYLTHDAPANAHDGKATKNDTYKLFSTHAFATPGPHTGDATLSVHCWNMKPGKTKFFQGTLNFNVYDEALLHTFKVPESAKRKETFSVEVSIAANAEHEWGNRIFICSWKADVFAVAADTAQYQRECPAGSKIITFGDIKPADASNVMLPISVLDGARLGSAKLVAVSRGHLEKQIDIKPEH